METFNPTLVVPKYLNSATIILNIKDQGWELGKRCVTVIRRF